MKSVKVCFETIGDCEVVWNELYRSDLSSDSLDEAVEYAVNTLEGLISYMRFNKRWYILKDAGICEVTILKNVFEVDEMGDMISDEPLESEEVATVSLAWEDRFESNPIVTRYVE